MNPFQEAARHAVRHRARAQWRAGLGRSALWVLPPLLAGVALHLAGFPWARAFCFSLVFWWLLIVTVLTVLRRPTPFQALARWDAARDGGDSEALASAWQFSGEAQPTEGQKLHLQQSAAALQKEDVRDQLARDLPSPARAWLGWLPLLLLLALFLRPLGTFGSKTDDSVGAEAANQAAAETKKLAEKGLDADKMKSLTDEEKKAVEKLREDLKKTAEAMKDAGGDSKRDLMAALEKRAREAEKLAETLKEDQTWASAELLAELRRHADTADMGDTVANKDAKKTAQEALKLAAELNSETLTHEASERLASALKDIGKAATPEDKAKPVGQHSAAADQKMKARQPKPAAEEFQALAAAMNKKAERQNAQNELQKLANQLRQSEMNIAGQKNQSNMEKLPGQPPQQAQKSQSTPLQAPSDLQPLQMPSGPLPQPNDMSRQAGMAGKMTPVPGTLKPGQGKGDKTAFVPGAKPGQGGKPVLFAPIPGTKPGPGAGGKPMSGPLPGFGKAGNMAGLGGSEAGVGTTKEATGAATKPKETAFDALVQTEPGASGDSAMRAVEGQPHQEEAARARREVSLQNLRLEEEALDEKNLPASRRDQVKRYFNSLREKLGDE